MRFSPNMSYRQDFGAKHLPPPVQQNFVAFGAPGGVSLGRVRACHTNAVVKLAAAGLWWERVSGVSSCSITALSEQLLIDQPRS